MSDNKRVERIEPTPLQTQPTQNVQGWERIGSVAGGVMMMGKGLRRGGVFGLIQIAIGGVALARGITGHSSLKSLLEQSRQDMGKAHSKIERAGAEPKTHKANAEAAPRSGTVAADESLESPETGA